MTADTVNHHQLAGTYSARIQILSGRESAPRE